MIGVGLALIVAGIAAAWLTATYYAADTRPRGGRHRTGGTA